MLIDRKGGIFSRVNASLLLHRHLMPVFGVFFSWLTFLIVVVIIHGRHF
jgi:hypothetical protein